MTPALNVPRFQRAWIVERRGPPSYALTLRSEYPVPTPGKGEVLVKVQAAALNPVGFKIMRLVPNFMANRPVVAEHDFAGIIADANGSEFKNGDPVFGYVSRQLNNSTREGALAQYLRVPASHVVTRPSNVTATEAAGFTLAGQTAWQSLFNLAKLEAGQTVFINGGSSSVGAFAIQIAKAKGIKVVATASAKNEELVRGLGADEFIDYTKEPLHQYLTSHPPNPKFHAIIDAVALIDPSLYTHSPAYLAPSGIFISTGPFPRSANWPDVSNLFKTIIQTKLRPKWLGGTDRKFSIVVLANDKKDLEGIRDLVAEGKLKPMVDSVFSFEDTLKAYDRIMSYRARGKVVVKVDSEAD